MTSAGRSSPDPELPEWAPPLAEALVEALPRLHGEPSDPSLGEVITALTLALVRGELDLPLSGPPPPGVTPEDWPGRHRRALRLSGLAQSADGPLLQDGESLRWRRWHERRRTVLDQLQARLDLRCSRPTAAAVADASPDPRLDPVQRQAVQAVLRHGLVLLEGGPGTGKTTTVAAMVRAYRSHFPAGRIQLAAPTGKAAVRLRSATGGAIPCATVHGLLEYRGGIFGRDQRHPLPLDLLVVDEMSMVDMGLMEALLDALPTDCRLVLVGDPDQLPPVRPGPLLAELQRDGWRQFLGERAIRLRTTHRNDGAITAVAAALRAVRPTDDPLEAIKPLLERLPARANLRWRRASPLALPSALLDALSDRQRRLALMADGWDPADAAATEALLGELEQELVLVPFRRGRWGLEAIHRSLLGERCAGPPSAWPVGTPVLCNRNLPDLGLANGDLGVLVVPTDSDGERRLLFNATPIQGGDAGDNGDPHGAVLRLHPAQLAGAVEPALALTVHKAQGSEAERVIVLLPPTARVPSGLLYTALTRARGSALLISASS